ncbi:MAG: HYR domain-containing protein [Saprospiraceae bacterium]|nr:HYR domain-containing protein [Saprospiraceae bacterium]
MPDVILQDQCAQVHGLTATIETVDPYTGLITNTILLPGNITNFPGNNISLPDTLGVMGSSGCLPVGDHRVTYTAEDACGNTSTCMFTLSVKDYSPPTAVCTEFTVVALGLDDPNDCYEPNQSTCQFAGVGYMAAVNLDAGSYDNCNAIKFTVRRKAPYSDCINSLNACEKDIATAESDTLKFYCCEVGTSQKVILRVYQLDPDGNLSTLPDGSFIYNECEVEVEVQDKLKPLCEPPLNVTVTCNLFDPSLWSYGLPVVVDNCCLDTSYNFMGVKGLQHTVNYSNFDSVCNKGTITRTFRAYDCRGAFSQCTQRVVVTYNQNYAVKFPDDKFITQCDSLGTAFGEPQFLGEDCELLGVSYEDVIFTVVPDACYKIERTWQIINWCTYLPDAPCINVPNPTPNSNLNSAANMVGPTVSALGTPAPWAPTVVKITPTDPQATNYSTFWNANANCYRYKQIIKVQDQQDPVAVCPTSPVEVCDLSNNDATLWNDLQFWNAAHNSHDLCEGTANISISATDFCSGPHLTFRYILFLDLDGNGTMETVVNSVVPPAPGQVNYNNLGTVNFTGGTPITFDERGVPSNQVYRWALQTTVNGTSITGQITWNTAAAPNTHTPVQLPHGRHKVKWLVMDGCGNETTCEYDIIVKDCKAPTVTCINGLSVNMMPTNMITLYAADFLLNAEDNCTPLEFLKFGIRKSGTGTGFPYGPDGNPQISVTFDCSEVGTQPVEIWAIDSEGNADYCETYVIVQDNGGNCNTTNATVAGMLRTEADQGLEEAMMQISGQNPAGPTFSNFSITDQSGHYGFLNAVPMFANYTVTPNYDENPLNGVSTYDLVLISKHILGIETLNSPYKMLAADANKSGSITTFDIVELRKLLLGIYPELPANTSWRFVDKDFVFPNAQNPFQSAISENKTVAEIHDDQMNDNFVAIKVGDVNESAQANSLMTSETRSNSTMLFDLEEQQVEAGEEFTVTLTAAEKVLGCQFTLNYGAELQALEVIPVKEMDDNNFAILSGEHAVTASWNAAKGVAQPAFSLRFKALKSGQLSKMLSLSSRITATEYYAQQPAAGQSVERGNIALRFTSPQGSIITGQGFELYQNQPNPFVNRTQIGFYLPKSCTATLSVRDGNGQLVHSQKGDFAAGYNAFIVEKSALQNTASGLYYYTLETPDDAATRKMIQVK